MKKNKKVYPLFCFASVGLIALPMILTSCSGSNASSRTNLVTTYDNALDDAICLGIAPDYNSAGNWTSYVARYVQDLMKQSNTKQLDFRFFPKGETNTVNPKLISQTNADVVVANITDSAKQKEIDDVVNHIVYTGRGDDIDWCYNNETINFVNENNQPIGANNQNNPTSFTLISDGGKQFNNSFIFGDYGYTYNLYDLQQNPFLALKKLAISLDDLTNDKNNFEQKATTIEQMQQERLRMLNENKQVQQYVNNKTIAFVLGKKSDSNSKDVDSNFHLYTPHTYPQFYSDIDTKGLKMKFPIFNDINFFDGSHFADPDIIAGDSNSFHTFKNSSNGQNIIEAFKHKFDYVVYMAYDPNTYQFSIEDVAKSGLKDLLKITNTSTNAQVPTISEIQKHIFYTNYSDLYMSTWAPIGQSIGLSKFIEWINKNWIDNENDKIIEQEGYILHKNIDFSNLKRWSELK